MSHPYTHAAWIRLKKNKDIRDDDDSGHFYINSNYIESFYAGDEFLYVYMTSKHLYTVYCSVEEFIRKVKLSNEFLRREYEPRQSIMPM